MSREDTIAAIQSDLVKRYAFAPDVRAISTGSMMHRTVVTNSEVILAEDNGYTVRPFLRLPLANVASASVVTNAIGVHGPTEVGVRIDFTAPVVNNLHSSSESSISFDIGSVTVIDAGRVVQILNSDYGQSEQQQAEQLATIINDLARGKTGGVAPTGTAPDVQAQLKKLKGLLDQGLIDKDTYDKRAAELVKSL